MIKKINLKKYTFLNNKNQLFTGNNITHVFQLRHKKLKTDTSFLITALNTAIKWIFWF